MESLPSELLLQIFSFLQDDQFFSPKHSIQFVCKNWNALLQQSKFFWLQRFHSHLLPNRNDIFASPAPVSFISQYLHSSIICKDTSSNCPFHIRNSTKNNSISLLSICDSCFVSLFRRIMFQWKKQSSIFLTSLISQYIEVEPSESVSQFSKTQLDWNISYFQNSLVKWRCKVSEVIYCDSHLIKGLLCSIPISESGEQNLYVKVWFSKPLNRLQHSFTMQIPELMLQCRTYETIKASNPFQPVQQDMTLSKGPLIIPDIIDVEGFIELDPILFDESIDLGDINLLETCFVNLHAIDWKHVEEQQDMEPIPIPSKNSQISSFVHNNWSSYRTVEHQEESRVGEFQYAHGELFAIEGQVKKVYDMTRCFKLVPQIEVSTETNNRNWLQKFFDSLIPEVFDSVQPTKDLTIIFPPKSIQIERPAILPLEKKYPTLLKEQDEVMIIARMLYPRCLLAYEVLLKKPSYLCILRYLFKSLFSGSLAYLIHFKVVKFFAKGGPLKFSLVKYDSIVQRLKQKKMNTFVMLIVATLLVGVESMRIFAASTSLFATYLCAGLSAIHLVQTVKLLLTLFRQLL